MNCELSSSLLFSSLFFSFHFQIIEDNASPKYGGGANKVPCLSIVVFPNSLEF